MHQLGDSWEPVPSTAIWARQNSSTCAIRHVTISLSQAPKAVQIGHKIDSENKIGCMIARMQPYPKTRNQSRRQSRSASRQVEPVLYRRSGLRRISEISEPLLQRKWHRTFHGAWRWGRNQKRHGRLFRLQLLYVNRDVRCFKSQKSQRQFCHGRTELLSWGKRLGLANWSCRRVPLNEYWDRYRVPLFIVCSSSKTVWVHLTKSLTFTDTSMKMGLLSVNGLLEKCRLRTTRAKTAGCP